MNVLSGDTTKFIDEMYVLWKEEMESVYISWWVYFRKMEVVICQCMVLRKGQKDGRKPVTCPVQRHSAIARHWICLRVAIYKPVVLLQTLNV